VLVKLNSVIIVETKTEKINRRKACVKAKMEDFITGILLVKTDALFLKPRNANAFGRII
jgi:hypothetical protein